MRFDLVMYLAHSESLVSRNIARSSRNGNAGSQGILDYGDNTLRTQGAPHRLVHSAMSCLYLRTSSRLPLCRICVLQHSEQFVPIQNQQLLLTYL